MVVGTHRDSMVDWREFMGSHMETNMVSEAETQNLQAKLKKIGWNITSEGVTRCCEDLANGKYTAENIIKAAVDFDLKDIGASVLTEDVKRGRATSIEGPIVLQVQKIRNVSAPKANEESSGAPRMLKIQLTDGHTTCFALENSSIPQLSLSTPPGTKVRLKGTIPLFIGFILLEPGRVEKLGGKVEKLLTKWEANRNIPEQRARAGIDSEGPPLFVPFDIKTSNSLKKTSNDKFPRKTDQVPTNSTTSTNHVGERTNTKTHDYTGQNKNQRAGSARYDGKDRYIENRGAKRDEGGRGNFPRQAQVAENKRTVEQKRSSVANDKSQVREGAQAKKTGPPSYRNDQKDYSHGNMRRNREYQDDKSSRNDGQRGGDREKHDERRRNDKRGARNDDRNDDQISESRPSQGTLWDFLEKRFPINEAKNDSKSFSERTPKMTSNNEVVSTQAKTVNQGSNNEFRETGTNDRKEHKDFPRPGSQGRHDGNRGTRNNSRNSRDMAENAQRGQTKKITQVAENDDRQNKDTRKKGYENKLDKKHETVLREKQNEKPVNESVYNRETNKKDKAVKPDDKTGLKQVPRDDRPNKGNNQQGSSDNRRTTDGPARNQDWNKKQSDGAKNRDFVRKDTWSRENERSQQERTDKKRDDQMQKRNPSREENDQKRNDSGKSGKPRDGTSGHLLESGGREKIEKDSVENGSLGIKEKNCKEARTNDKEKPCYQEQPRTLFNMTSSQNMARNQRYPQHWWKKGEQCMAFCSKDNQDVQSNYNEQMYSAPQTPNPSYFQQPLPYGVPIMHGGWVHAQRAPYQQYVVHEEQMQPLHNNAFPRGQANNPQLSRPTQSFYRPPSRDFNN